VRCLSVGDKSVTLFVIRKGGHSYVYIAWPTFTEDPIVGICDAIANHAADPGVPMTMDDAWIYMSELMEVPDEGYTDRNRF